MADFDTAPQCASEEELIQRHKQERKSLQAEIQKLKHSVTKGDRKKKKEINEKIAVLEADLDAKHEKELAEFKLNGPIVTDQSTPDAVLCDGIQKLVTEDNIGDATTVEVKPKKPSKAQKRRHNGSLKEIFGFQVTDIHVMEEIISFCEFHKIEMQFGIPCEEDLFDNIIKRNTMSRSSFVWAKLLGVAPSMMWPVKMVKLPLVYCNCDNAWLRLKEIEKIELFRINDIEKWRSAAQNVVCCRDVKTRHYKDKKAARDQERELNIKEQETDNLTSSRHLEDIKIKQILSQRGLQIHQIPSDGNCLYAAVAHQIGEKDIKPSVESLRQQVAGYMRTHQDDFIPFLTKDNGDCYTPEDFEEYCKLTESTPAWGGQLEIQALSHLLSCPIEVVQSDGPPLMTGEEHKIKSVILTYYRHAFGLGEHYNSVEDKVEEEADEFT